MSIRTAIIGPTGYTGYWLIELLLRHPEATISYLGSARRELPNIAEEFPQLLRRCEMECRPIDPEAIAEAADVAFMALPHKAAMEHVPRLLDAGLRVVDFSADYRLRDPDLYERVYHTPHIDRSNLAHAVYGLPELTDADRIAGADLVANPGCYPTAAALAAAPLLQRGLVKTDRPIIIDAASGVTGAGRSAKPHLHFPEVEGSFFAYGCGDHRHQPEIDQALADAKGHPLSTLFVPHLIPTERGLLATLYLDPQDDQVSEDDLFEAFEQAYAGHPFVRVRAEMPNIRYVRDTNFCDITVRLTGGDGPVGGAVGGGEQRKIVVFSAIDNMIKGASGQAIQNMNIMFDLDPAAGLGITSVPAMAKAGG